MLFINLLKMQKTLQAVFLCLVIACIRTQVQPCLVDEPSSVYSVQHCPPGWVRYKSEKCFKLFSEYLNHKAAERSCRNIDSTLAAIASAEEHEFLKSYIHRDLCLEKMQNVWLGGESQQSLWFWTDLSPYSYTNWWPGHPDFKQGYQVGLVTGNNYFVTHPNLWGLMGTWNGNSTIPYICQKFQQDCRTYVKRD